MGFLLKANNAYSKIATVGGINNSDDPVTFSVTTGEGSRFPASNFVITIDSEILLCTSRTGDSLTCTRAQESTTIAAHAQNADVEHRITKGTLLEHENIPNNTAFQGKNAAGTAQDLLKVDASDIVQFGDADLAGFQNNLPYADLASMARQALINGNFDVWQRGTTLTAGSAVEQFLADRWKSRFNADAGGTNPTIVISRQTLTSGDIPNAFYHFRIAPNGAGSSFGADSFGAFYQNIEHGVRLLCGASKKVTVSFYARSSIANKRLGVYLQMQYGSGGTPSAGEVINGTNWTLTSSWVKYTYTFTTNTLASKTFGTANDDYLQVGFPVQWNTTYKGRSGSSTNEDYGGNGTIDIAQVQLCIGPTALPFQPKSYEDELRACRRFYQRFDSSLNAYTFFGAGAVLNSTTIGTIIIHHPVRMRAVPTLPDVSAANTFTVRQAVLTAIALDIGGQDVSDLQITVASGLTAYQGLTLYANNSTAAYLGFSAEL
ncbi:MAG: hypothetical protein M1445_08515 [Bacteroidetes bacterium]|nr:hypothetical protein [Bacteroidota bacterium]